VVAREPRRGFRAASRRAPSGTRETRSVVGAHEGAPPSTLLRPSTNPPDPPLFGAAWRALRRRQRGQQSTRRDL
jgi:hypothetical protein